MRFSLILATVGRVSELERFLEALNIQTHRRFELIVVDQNKDERLSPVLASHRERFSILHLRSEPGLSRARNVGLGHITGDVVAFPDDDCWYPPELLERVAAFLDDHPKLDGVTGREETSRGQIGTHRFDKRSGLLTRSNVWRRASSNTLFLRRSVVEEVGGFDETLGVGSGTLWGAGEDIDYPLRAVKTGFKIAYKPDICVVHPVGGRSLLARDYAKLSGRAYKYGAGLVESGESIITLFGLLLTIFYVLVGELFSVS